MNRHQRGAVRSRHVGAGRGIVTLARSGPSSDGSPRDPSGRPGRSLGDGPARPLFRILVALLASVMGGLKGDAPSSSPLPGGASFFLCRKRAIARHGSFYSSGCLTFCFDPLQATSSTRAPPRTTARSISAGGRPARRADSRNAFAWAC